MLFVVVKCVSVFAHNVRVKHPVNSTVYVCLAVADRARSLQNADVDINESQDDYVPSTCTSVSFGVSFDPKPAI